jgi:hypothetical protein
MVWLRGKPIGNTSCDAMLKMGGMPIVEGKKFDPPEIKVTMTRLVLFLKNILASLWLNGDSDV